MKIKKGQDDDEFVISGNRKSLTNVRRQLIALIEDTVLKHFDAKQPGLRRYFESGKGDRLVKLVEKDQNCAIQVQMNVGQSIDENHDHRDGDGSGGGNGGYWPSVVNLHWKVTVICMSCTITMYLIVP